MIPTTTKVCHTCSTAFKNSEDLTKYATRIRVCSLGHLWFNCKCDSTLFFQNGTFPWFSVDSILSKRTLSIYNKYDKIQKMPKIHHQVMKLQEIIENPNHSNEVIKSELEKVPTIAMLVLNMASNIHPQGEKINDLAYAISLIGRSTLSHIVLSCSLVEFKIHSKVYKASHFWQEALATAAISRCLLEKYSNSPSQESLDSVYFGSCFAQVGKLVASMSFPEKIDQVFEYLSNPKTLCTWAKSCEINDFSSLESLGEIGSVMWGLPDYVTHIILNFNRNFKGVSPTGQLSLLEAAQFGNILFHWLNSTPHLINTDLLDYFKKKLKLNDKEIEILILSLRSKKEEVDILGLESYNS